MPSKKKVVFILVGVKEARVKYHPKMNADATFLVAAGTPFYGKRTNETDAQWSAKVAEKKAPFLAQQVEFLANVDAAIADNNTECIAIELDGCYGGSGVFPKVILADEVEDLIAGAAKYGRLTRETV